MLAIVIYCLRLFNFYCCHGDGSDGRHVYSMYYGHMHNYCFRGDVSDGRHVCTKYHGHTHYYQATMLVIVINCLRLFVVVIYCYHGDGSDGRHVCTKYHGHTHYYQATTLVIA